MNRMLHIAATTQIRLDTEGRRYYAASSQKGRRGWKPCGA